MVLLAVPLSIGLTDSLLDKGPDEHDDDAEDGRNEGVESGPVLHANLLAGVRVPVIGCIDVQESRQPGLCVPRVKGLDWQVWGGGAKNDKS